MKNKTKNVQLTSNAVQALEETLALYQQIDGIKPTITSLVERALLDLLDKKEAEKALKDSLGGK